MDVSADLTELARTPVTVVCAGVKSILDIPRTMEVPMPHRTALTCISCMMLTSVPSHCESQRELPARQSRHLQVLETMGVCVAAYGADEFPAFFSASSGCTAPARIDSAAQAAALVRSVQQLDLGSGVVIGERRPLASAMHVSTSS
jgi:pseudouridylate synthase